VTVSELAFMALGLLLGAAGGAAIIVFFGTRLPRREIRVTVTRDALPRRSETLSQDAFVTSPGEPARGGPGDRRGADRAPAEDLPTGPSPTPASPVGIPVGPAVDATPIPSRDRTIVPIGPGRSVSGANPTRPHRPRVTTTVPIGQAGAPILPPILATPMAGSVEAEPARARAAPIAVAAITIDEQAAREPEPELEPHGRPWTSALERMLRGEHRAMAEVLDQVAGPDSQRRREWELLLGGLVEAMENVAVREAVIDFPMGTAFWDSFTVEQCRRIVGALATMGYAYDGHDGWVDSRAPAYRDLSTALADVGIDPRRMRAWPHSTDIAGLFVGARPAPEELLAAAGPAYAVDDVRELVGDRATELQDLWLAWDVARPALFEEHRTPR
jgi:hypothetical protein